MAEESESKQSTVESVMGKIIGKIHDHDSSSDSDSDSDHKNPSSPSSVKAKIYRVFGRERPVHHFLGGGKSADVLLWRNKKISAGVLGGATAIWVLFELMEYHLLPLLCHTSILSIALIFLFSNAYTFIHKTPPHIPEVHLPGAIPPSCLCSDTGTSGTETTARYCLRKKSKEVPYGVFIFMSVVILWMIILSLTGGEHLYFRCLEECHPCFGFQVIAASWVLSIVGSWCNFLTLFYIAFVLLHTVPVLYEKYEDKVHQFAEKAMVEIKKQYAVFNAKVLSKRRRMFRMLCTAATFG